MKQTLTIEFYRPDLSEMVACFESESFNLSHSRTTYDAPSGKVITVHTTHHFDMLVEKTIKEGQIDPYLVMRHYINGIPDKRINFLKIVNLEVQNGISGTRLLIDVRTESDTLLNGFQ